jgi:hypothetical protein
MICTNESKPATTRRRRAARASKPAGKVETSSSAPTAEVEAERAKPVSKSSLVLAMLQRHEGATIAQIVKATGWLPHTTRATLTGLKKNGHQLTSEKPEDEERVYRVAAG